MTAHKVDIEDATRPLAEYAKRVENGGELVLVTSGGRPVAAVIPMTDEDDLERLALSTNPKFLEIVERSRASHAREGGISHEDMRRRLMNP
jgi:prevent-host-death family protein